jgi:hypothetical protein
MYDHPSETKRAKEPTVEGRHLHEPDAFPHSMIGVLAFFVVLFPIVVGAFYVAAGIGGALIGAGLLLFIGFPIVVAKLERRTEEARAAEEAQEREVEEAEAAGLPPRKTPEERLNDRLNMNFEQRNPPHPHF